MERADRLNFSPAGALWFGNIAGRGGARGGYGPGQSGNLFS